MAGLVVAVVVVVVLMVVKLLLLLAPHSRPPFSPVNHLIRRRYLHELHDAREIIGLSFINCDYALEDGPNAERTKHISS